MNFYEWLVTQKNADTPIGDLVRDVMRDMRCPKNSSDIEVWTLYLARVYIRMTEILQEAFDEYHNQ